MSASPIYHQKICMQQHYQPSEDRQNTPVPHSLEPQAVPVQPVAIHVDPALPPTQPGDHPLQEAPHASDLQGPHNASPQNFDAQIQQSDFPHVKLTTKGKSVFDESNLAEVAESGAASIHSGVHIEGTDQQSDSSKPAQVPNLAEKVDETQHLVTSNGNQNSTVNQVENRAFKRVASGQNLLQVGDGFQLQQRDRSDLQSNFAVLSKAFENSVDNEAREKTSDQDIQSLIQSEHSQAQERPENSSQLGEQPMQVTEENMQEVNAKEETPISHTNQTGRAVRQCAKYTPNYSATHKGILSKSQKSDSQPGLRNPAQPGAELDDGPGVDNAVKAKGLEPVSDLTKTLQLEAKPKSLNKRSADDIARTYRNMLAFDWDLKDINNLKHPPDREVTPSVLWFYINSLFFPYNAHNQSKVPFKEFAAPILDKLSNSEPFQRLEQQLMMGQSFNQSSENIKEAAHETNGDQNIERQMSTENPEVPLQLTQPQFEPSTEPATPDLVQKLMIEENFLVFKNLVHRKMEALQDLKFVNSLSQDQHMDEYDEQEIEASEEAQDDAAALQKLEDMFQAELEQTKSSTRSELERQYANFTSAYEKADLIAEQLINGIPQKRAVQVYKSTEIQKYGLEFDSQVDPHYVADIRHNLEWYLSNQNEILLNVGYPSKQEKKFLRHIEQWQQEKNDQNYRKILQQLADEENNPNGGSGIHGLDLGRFNALSAHQRGLVVQDDAQCAICNNGDYEDEDLIVFCGACSIPVHQRCYGIDEIPVNDWICNNCWAFNMRRGIQVKCLLCPKRGGAMKPTNIFRTHEHFMKYYTAASKKKGMQQAVNFANLARDSQTSVKQLSIEGAEEVPDSPQAAAVKPFIETINTPGHSKQSKKHQLLDREDKNHALSQILCREGNFQEALILRTKEAGETFPQNQLDLHFLQSESIAEIPEDYTFFLQRNEQRLEHPDVVPTETLYEWVHLSCAMWIPGPSVTPKTPVRMQKIDMKRFELQCIICGKKNAGACIQCQYSRCKISFHIECARRANYFLEVERVDRERIYRVFCEKHRPLKIVRELEEKDKSTLDEVMKFSKVVERCMEISARTDEKIARQRRVAPFSKVLAPALPSKREVLAEKRLAKQNIAKQKKMQRMQEIEAKKQARIRKAADRQLEKIVSQQQKSNAIRVKESKQVVKKVEKQVEVPVPVRIKAELVAPKWKEKDKRVLYDRIREKYLQLIKLRINVIRVDPMIKIRKRQDRIAKKKENELKKKRKEKEQAKMAESARFASKMAQREGLRSRHPSTMLDGINFMDVMNETEALIDPTLMGDAAVQDLQYVNPVQINSAGLLKEAPLDDFKTDQPDSDNNEEHNSSNRPGADELLDENIDPYFKFGNPAYLQELDWAITFSKYDFPWHEIRFGKFSAKDCFKTYTSTIRDAQSFYKKVLCNKDKLKKLVVNQLDEPPRIFFGTEPEIEGKVVDDKKSQQKNKAAAEVIEEKEPESESEQFCKCKGTFKSVTGYFVACEADADCENGGWLHPECTTDLCLFTKEQIDLLDTWYCEDCVHRLKKNSALKDDKVVSEHPPPNQVKISVAQSHLNGSLRQFEPALDCQALSEPGQDIEVELEHTDGNYDFGEQQMDDQEESQREEEVIASPKLVIVQIPKTIITPLPQMHQVDYQMVDEQEQEQSDAQD